ncbi:MAG: hypothetical protein H7Z40_17355 [Phycisphaerae bacterium]|nr:hypothetical protein [Gemmatimonadaceae bacterium]
MARSSDDVRQDIRHPRPTSALNRWWAIVLLTLLPDIVTAQSRTARPLRIFLDCESCSSDYMRNETRWVEFVRDRTVSDVHVLVTDINTGSGGEEYTIEMVGLGSYAGRVDTLRLVVPPTQTSTERRDALTRIIQLGLVPFAARTAIASRIRVSLDGEDDEKEERATPANDPWKAWVFEAAVSGSIERESRQRSSNVGASFEASRVTSLWKAGFDADFDRRRNRFELEERTVTSTRESYSSNVILVRSFGPHWGAGAQAAISSSSFANTKRAIRAAPAIEYSIWPYEEATRKQLTLQYSLGVSDFTYREETLFDRFHETRPTQTFVAGYDIQQRWGDAEAEFQYSNYVDDPKQYRLEFDANLNVRISRGLQLELGASASQIRDQLSLVKRGASDDEVLLELQALRTDYQLNGYIGLRFTFGSIFNSVVNPRFGGGPGELLR